MPDEEQIHTTGSCHWSDAYLDMKQQQTQIRRDLPEMERNWPDHEHIEFTLQFDDNDVTHDEEQMYTTCTSYWSDAYLDMKQQQSQIRRATDCANGHVASV